MGIETALRSIFSRLDPEVPDLIDGVLLALENVLHQVTVLQPLLGVEVAGFNQVTENIKTIVQELASFKYKMQRDNHYSRCKPTICITEAELCNLIELHFSQVEISKPYGRVTNVKNRLSRIN